jgi:hypothetical protein
MTAHIRYRELLTDKYIIYSLIKIFCVWLSSNFYKDIIFGLLDSSMLMYVKMC